MELSSFIKDILFVIVLYKRKPEEVPALHCIVNLSKELSVLATIFIYDNSPQPNPPTATDIIYRHDPKNSGVSKGYNEGCKLAVEKNKKWLLLVDQDTAFDRAFPEHLFSAFMQYPQSSVFVPILIDYKGIVSPFQWSHGKGKRITSTEHKPLLKKYRFANSGLLIKRETFELAGGYIESIPLDFSDIAFADKLKKITDHFIVVDVNLNHPFSATEKISKEAALHRYYYFCIGAIGIGKFTNQVLLYYLRALLRGLNLAVKYKSVDFLKIFLKYN